MGSIISVDAAAICKSMLCNLVPPLTERSSDNDPGQSVWQDWPVKEPSYQGLEGEVVSLTIWHTGNLARITVSHKGNLVRITVWHTGNLARIIV